MSQIPELVRDSKLSTKIDAEHTTHTFLESGSVAGRRSRRREREEVWKKKRHLGIGIFGTVWLEECVSENQEHRLRAVKEVRKMGPAAKAMDYNRELETIAKFSQQKFDGCFVQSSGWFESPDAVCIAMEYLPNGDLQKYMTQPFPENEAQQITFQLLEGLDYMHSSGFAHHDLRPQNIFVLSYGPDWWVKIGDFGLSKRVMEGFTGLQTFNSTPAFTAPEVYEQAWKQQQEDDAPVLDSTPEADIWALGVIVYYMLTAKLPFSLSNHLLDYYNGETGLPVKSLTLVGSSPDATSFLESVMAAKASDRSTAADALNHVWVEAAQQEPPPPSPTGSQWSFTKSPRLIPTALSQREPITSTNEAAPEPIPDDDVPPLRVSNLATEKAQELFAGDDTSKYVINDLNLGNPPPSAANTSFVQRHPSSTTDTESIAPSEDSERPVTLTRYFRRSTGKSEDSERPVTLTRYFHQLSASDISPGETLPSHPSPGTRLSSQLSSSDVASVSKAVPSCTRRRSDAAPIPISDLESDVTNTKPGGPPSITSSRNGVGGDRWDKFRRASQNMNFVPRWNRHGRKVSEISIPSSLSRQVAHHTDGPFI
ncbi:hypothetical protein N7474_001013 [Penicillium riverlandense]|uniref:uncharacterized protein n=1 Tax=Penicillium riverlandense TaxID=1903569 RepID=UPI002548A422|nr:uncharacterized protein N7474_001013 [Penicillium riverlandense]KAJ5832702.1 hypothetical protein N7474_001013 [Penicillium riverlandense]